MCEYDTLFPRPRSCGGCSRENEDQTEFIQQAYDKGRESWTLRLVAEGVDCCPSVATVLYDKVTLWIHHQICSDHDYYIMHEHHL